MPYQEGDLFAVPLRDGDDYALGLVSRLDGNGEVLGFFFGPRLSRVPTLQEVPPVTKEDSIYTQFFGDLGFLEDEWPIIGQLPGWDRTEWAAPDFGAYYEAFNAGSRYSYIDEGDYVVASSEVDVPREEAESLPQIGLAGYGAVELILTHLL